jgi:hypothetical protein
MSFDINFIMNGTKGKVLKQKPQKKVQPFTFKLLGKPLGIIGDHVTKPQRKAIKRDPWGDWDKDGVINGLDCAPRNKRKHMAWDKNPDNRETSGGWNDDSTNGFEPDHTRKIVLMPPKEFLKRQYEQSDAFKEKKDSFEKWKASVPQSRVDKYAEIIKSKDQTLPIPYELYDKMGNRKDMQEGRTRGLSSEKLGVMVPVEMARKRENPWDREHRIIYKDIPTDEAYEMRKKWAGQMDVHRSDITMDRLKYAARQGKLEPIDVQESTFKKGILNDGKHRILVKKELGQPTVTVKIHPDIDDPYTPRQDWHPGRVPEKETQYDREVKKFQQVPESPEQKMQAVYEEKKKQGYYATQQ